MHMMGMKKKSMLLEIAFNLFEELISIFGEKKYIYYNRMQIKKRRGLLYKSDVYTLSKMDSMDKQEECGRYILLGNKRGGWKN